MRQYHCGLRRHPEVIYQAEDTEAGVLRKAPLGLTYSPPEPPATQKKNLELNSGSLKVPQALATRHSEGGGEGCPLRL